MFTITPIGSCRITTPLRRGQSVHGFNLNMERCYGYCHSPAEAVQMARFMQGVADIPHDIWPLVSRAHDLNVVSANTHDASDLYVVELASAKEVTVDGVSIQLNYLNATFAEFFADTTRAQSFWALAESGDTAAQRAFLDHHWAATPQQREDARMLGKMRLQFVTRDSLQRDIKTLTEMLPDVLFVSHVDARKEDGRPIGSRSRFIEMVSEEVTLAGCKFFNPTDLMDVFGQSAAIEDESAGLAHFTDEFARGVMDQWMGKVIAPKTDAFVRNGVSNAMEIHLPTQIAAACDTGRFAQAIARLRELSNDGATVDVLLSDVMQAQQRAIEVFRAKIADGLTEGDREALVLEAGEIGVFKDALTLAETTAPEPFELPVHVLMRVADIAATSGDLDTAFAFYLAAARRGHRPVYDNLAKLAVTLDLDLLAKLETGQRASFLSHVTPAIRIQLLQLNGAALTEAVSPETTPEEAEEIVRDLSATHGIGYAAEVLAAWREHQGTDRITHPGLVAVLDSWAATALSFEERLDRIHGLHAVLFAAPRHQPSRVAMQDIRKELALLIRSAGKAGDIDLLDALSSEAAALSQDLPELDLWRARLRFARGEYMTALQLGKSAAALLPETINVWVLLMRAATKAQQKSEAVEFARNVIGLACPKTEALKSEAEAIVQTHLVGA
ncbi:hypothetical protein SAMN05444273_10620 [Litoreibacter ascidiaceicola]|uniref:Tetratricopeptide repeat-containing protein n=1 Tax=Litoreibacter ascidiaceicola TaxID=1486859 RepID=A0A1M5BL38_9RHOB|nr:hypothetical protein [Litoreibacter ascidiaceicola]SHF42967.1 hypothetical protein SAMN05444273_10620 [Litoreibacter ascidiaceicola]